MKSIKTIISIYLLVVLISSCTKWDNFEAPDSGIEGTIIDGGTGNPLEVKSPGGGTIRLLQQDPQYENPSPIDVEIMSDGRYKHTMLFAGTYKVLPRDGAFKFLNDTAVVAASHGQVVKEDFEVMPYFRLSASMDDSTFTYTISKPETTTEKVHEVIFMVNNYEIVNESVSANSVGYYKNLWKSDLSGVPDSEILNVPRSFTINWSETHLPKGDYYFRVGVRPAETSKYNYSPVFEHQIR